MVQLEDDAIAAVNNLIEGASMRLRGLDTSSVQYQHFNAELEAYGRVLDVLLHLNERQSARIRTIQQSAAKN